ncbi:hypothetical protein EVAR_39474_1 [Eumeta japonica]|uniref:Uncharacterized protein n=1 Tax=Eumeta variegata TaxID=151549 RepID=A0A4C1VYW8_EUMVA|nr:hypothetical protein EVAR_39474_1 [Eumeta japonica]
MTLNYWTVSFIERAVSFVFSSDGAGLFTQMSLGSDLLAPRRRTRTFIIALPRAARGRGRPHNSVSPNCGGRGARCRPGTPRGIGQSSGPSSPPGCLCSGININKRPRAPPYFCGRRDARGIVRAIRIWPLAAATGYLEAAS